MQEITINNLTGYQNPINTMTNVAIKIGKTNNNNFVMLSEGTHYYFNEKCQFIGSELAWYDFDESQYVPMELEFLTNYDLICMVDSYDNTQIEISDKISLRKKRKSYFYDLKNPAHRTEIAYNLKNSIYTKGRIQNKNIGLNCFTFLGGNDYSKGFNSQKTKTINNITEISFSEYGKYAFEVRPQLGVNWLQVIQNVKAFRYN